MKNFLLQLLQAFRMVSEKPKKDIPRMVFVEGGTFAMGSEDGNEDEKPVHNVTINSFKMGKYPVTVAQYKTFCQASGQSMPEAPSWGWIDKHPVVNVNFDEANAYCKWLSKSTAENYRLPTEAEWEFAARGGNNSLGYTYSGSNNSDEISRNSENSEGNTQICGRKKPNELGLYDMCGNIWEWCNDWYDHKYYANSPNNNPKGVSIGAGHVVRGGCWDTIAHRLTFRFSDFEDSRFHILGFRIVSEIN
jgi:formylglycine-generating enzyme required for sulfatase activity